MELTAKDLVSKWFPKEIKSEKQFYYYKLKAIKLLGQYIGMWGKTSHNSFQRSGKPLPKNLILNLFWHIHDESIQKHQYVATAILLDYYFPEWRAFATKEVIGTGVERRDAIMRVWRKEVLFRDGYRCTECGSEKNLQAHHIYEWSDFPGLRTDIENGITLCGNCHHKEHPNMAAEIFNKNMNTN